MKREKSTQAIVQADPKTCVALVVARFNSVITEALLAGAKQALSVAGVPEEQYGVFYVPGSVELPLIAAACAETEKYQAIVCLGAVIRGETDHYKYVCELAANGIQKVSLQYRLPVMFGVLTCDTQAQAQERTKPDESNTGYQVTLGAIEMINTLKVIS